MKPSENATQAPRGWTEMQCSPKTRLDTGGIYRLWIPNRAKQATEKDSVLVFATVQGQTPSAWGTVYTLTAPDGKPIFPPFKTENVYQRDIMPVSILVQTEGNGELNETR